VEWRLDGIQQNRWLHKARDMQLQVTSVGKIIHEVEMYIYSGKQVSTQLQLDWKWTANAEKKALQLIKKPVHLSKSYYQM
jgi:hypothetical protein